MLRIVFMGTPEFAVPTLSILLDAGYSIPAVVTAPDKPAGRGRKISISPVKEFALSKKIPLLQPEKLKDPGFLSELRNLEADLFVVVAFRMLPELVFSMPPLKTINLHASLLPEYRGAAPINHALMNGEKESGLTTFFIEQKIDTGAILLQEKISIGADENFGALHDRMKISGAKLVLETVKLIESEKAKPHPQPQKTGLVKEAPKLTREIMKIDWEESAEKIHNKIRGLSPYPAAFTFFSDPEGKTFPVKILSASHTKTDSGLIPGEIRFEGNDVIKIGAAPGTVFIHNLHPGGGKAMDARSFLAGIRKKEGWKAVSSESNT